MASAAFKNIPYKLALTGPRGSFDVAGVDGSHARTWTDYSPALPDPAGEGDWSGYEYRYLFKIGDRFYLPFAAGSLYAVSDVYVYSWAPGEPDWTQEFSGNAGVFPSNPYDGGSWDAATDGTSIFIVFTIIFSTVIDCGTGSGNIKVRGDWHVVKAFSGARSGSWNYLGAISQTSFLHGQGSGLNLALCASPNDVGNAYMVASDGGIDVCTGRVSMENTWVTAFGPTQTFVDTFPPVLGPGDDRHQRFLLTGRYLPENFDGGEFPIAFINDISIVNDGDDLQVICRLPENGAGPHDGFNQTKISVYKPLETWTTFEEQETNAQTGEGWDYWFEDPVLTFDTEDAFTKVVTPVWTENSGRRQRAIIANYADFNDLIGLDANGLTLHHFHDNPVLDSTRLFDDAGVEASIDQTNAGEYYIPGIFYDPTGDEYWAIYQNATQLRSSVTTDACGGVEQWQGVQFSAGAPGVLSVGQGPFESDTFYVIANTTGDFRGAPKVIAIPICRGCMVCT